MVTYRVGDTVGTDRVAVTAPPGGSSAETGRWSVVDPLLVRGRVPVRTEHVPAFTFGAVRIDDSTNHTEVWGDPGRYVAKAVNPPQCHRAAPIKVSLGVEVDPPWADSLPTSEAESTDSEGE